MSSHHVVRNEQEPALVILDLTDSHRAILDQLLEWAPTIICTPESQAQLEHLGVKADIIYMDSDSPAENRNFIQSARIENNFLSDVFEDLAKAGYGGANIFVPGDYPLLSQRPEHHLLNCSYFCGNWKLSTLRRPIRKWVPEQECIQIIPLESMPKYSGLTHIKDFFYETSCNDFYVVHASAENPILIGERLFY